MKIKMKRLHEKAVVPKKAKEGDAGLDFVAVEHEVDVVNRSFNYHLGWAVEIPEGHVGLLFPRSSVGGKDIVLSNSVGVIDSGYRGELIARFKSTIPMKARVYDVGEKVVQLVVMPIPNVEVEVVENLTETDRGEGRFGSTGA